MTTLGLVLAAVLTLDAPFGRFDVTVPEFPARDFSIADFGAKPGEKATAAFAAAMAACERAGGGRVVVPAGKWLTGAVHFRNNCNLRLDAGATLEFTDDPADYPEVHTTWEGIECYNHSPLLFAYGVTNVAITGSGTIAPRMDFWRTWFARPPEHMKATEELYYWCSTNAPMASRRLLALDRAHMRPHLIQFNRCGNVLLDGFKIRESPFWMIHLYHSESCVVRNLDTFAHGHNNDGVDVDMTQNVLIENCHFDQGDDGVVLKAGRNADAWRLNRPTENVVVRDCDMVESHSLLGIGSELSGGVRNVWMTRCHVANTYSMLRIKTGRRRGGFVENVYIDHCAGDKVLRVFNIFTDYCAQWGKFPDFELRRTRIRNINVSDLTAGVVCRALELYGDRRLPARGIRVKNVTVGRAAKALTEVKNCEDVQIDGLRLDESLDLPPDLFVLGDRDGGWMKSVAASLKPGAKFVDFTRTGVSAGAFVSDGGWHKAAGRMAAGDVLAIAYPVDGTVRMFADSMGSVGATVVLAPPKGSDLAKAAKLAKDLDLDLVPFESTAEEVRAAAAGDAASSLRVLFK